jgi:hypothetical protein
MAVTADDIKLALCEIIQRDFGLKGQILKRQKGARK